MKQLQNLKVEIKLQTKINGSAQMPDGRQELILSSGDRLIADMYIPTFGVKPNSSCIHDDFLGANKFVMVDEFLKVKGTEDVWAIGDVSNVEGSQILFCDNQSAYLAKNMVLILSGRTPLSYKVSKSGMIIFLITELEFFPTDLFIEVMGIQVGRKTGTGHFDMILATQSSKLLLYNPHLEYQQS